MPEEEVKRHHTYFAEASALEGNLCLPFVQKFSAPTFVKLNENGGYVSQHAENFRLGGVMSFRSAYTQVAGNLDTKKDHGWNTLGTAVIEGLSVMDVITADRIVAQLSTDHPLIGYVPTITFLGTRFENLRIAGTPVKLDLNLNLFGSKLDSDAPYSESDKFREHVIGQYERIQADKELSSEARGLYNQVPSKSDRLAPIACSLVNHTTISHPGHSCGHVIEIPNFGRISLATVLLEQSDPHPETGIPRKTSITLKMLEMEMGCIGGGTGSGGGTKLNGGSAP